MSIPTILRIVRNEADPEGLDEDVTEAVIAAPAPGPQPEPEMAPAAVATLTGGQMAGPDQVKAALAHAWRSARLHANELADKEGSVVHGLLSAQPPSMKDQASYMRGRAWVPPGHEGGWAERLGVLYQAFIGLPGVAIGNLISGTCARPLRFFLFLIVTITILTAAYVWL